MFSNGKESKFQFTFFPPVGTQGSFGKEYTNDYSLNLLVGVSKSERKFALAGLTNIIREDAAGIQIAGLGNIIGGDAGGAQIAGLANIIKKDAAGLQISGLANIVGKDMAGFQTAGLYNRTKDIAGFQIAGLMNRSKDMAGFQIGGLANTSSDAAGFQIAGLLNCSKDVAGFQIAGLLNKARNAAGIQIALINIADKSDYPIGLVNIIKHGEMGVGITCNEIGSTVVSFRSGGKVLYGILGIGYNGRSVKDHQFVLQAGIGAHINGSKLYRTNIEVTASNLSTFAKKETAQYSLGIFPAFKIGKHLELFAGPTFNYLQTDELNNTDLFPDIKINLWKDFDGKDKLKQAYVGISGGVQFVF